MHERAGERTTVATLLGHRIGLGAAVVLVVVALAVTVIIGIVRTAPAPEQAVRITATGTPTPTPTVGGVFVHVSGAVRTPGLYELPTGARLVDAVAAAGGFAHDAERDGVNLARPVTDGEQIRVPIPGEETTSPPASGATTAAPAAGAKIDVNTADQAALETLPRIGPAMAGRILQWREKNGRFTSIDDLMAVSGIGPKMLEALRDLVTVG